MRALSLVRPHPWSIVSADCRLVNVPHQIDFRGDVVFRASKRFDTKALLRIQAASAKGGFKPCSGYKDAHPENVLAFVARVVNCRRVASFSDESLAAMPDRLRADGASELVIATAVKFLRRQAVWATGPWCLMLNDIRPCAPIACNGAQEWFNVPDDVVADALRGVA